MKTFKAFLEASKISYTPDDVQMSDHRKSDIVFTKDKIKGMTVGIYLGWYPRSHCSVGLYDPSDIRDNDYGVRPYIEIEVIRYKKIFVTDHTKAERSIQGLKMAVPLYLYLLKKLNITIMSGEQQSIGGRRMWIELWKLSRKDKGLSVYGYDPKATGKDQFSHLDINPDDPTELIMADDRRLYNDTDLEDELNDLYDKRYELGAKIRNGVGNIDAYKKELDKVEAEIKRVNDLETKDYAQTYPRRIIAYYKTNKIHDPFIKLKKKHGIR